MRTLEFKVDKQVLLKQPGCDFANIVAGSVGYLEAKFNFSEEWSECSKKVANFLANGEEFPVLLEDDACVIPSGALVGDYFEVYVIGAKGKEYRINTTKFGVKQEV